MKTLFVLWQLIELGVRYVGGWVGVIACLAVVALLVYFVRLAMAFTFR